jgi:hypothetical protein
MADLVRRKITAIWLLLILATVLSWETVHGFSAADLRIAASAAIIVAFIKVRFVMLHFMEIDSAPLPLRFFCEAWIVLVCAGILGLYWVA